MTPHEERPTEPSPATDGHGNPGPQTPEGRWCSREQPPTGEQHPWPKFRQRGTSVAPRNTANLVEGTLPPARARW